MINLKYIGIFFVSFLISFLYVYYLVDPKKTIIVYPTPDNQKKLQYIDKANNCFEYEYVESECPYLDHNVKTIPIED